MASQTDSFTRANENPLASPWLSWRNTVDTASTIQLLSNAAAWATGTLQNYYFYTGTNFDNYQFSKAKVTTATANDFGLGVNLVSGISGLFALWSGTNTLELAYRIANAPTQVLATTTDTLAVNDVIMVRLTYANVFEVYKNGTLLASATNTSGLKNGFPGLHVLTGSVLDDWAGGDILHITVHPSPVNVPAGNTATFSVTATGNGSLTYQWQKDNGAGGAFSDIGGATSSNYTTAATVFATDNGVRFRCNVTDTYMTTTSDSANLTVSKVSSEAWVKA